MNANGVCTANCTPLNVLSGIAYSNLIGWTWANGVAYQRGYDGFGRLSSYALGNPAGTGAAAGRTRTLPEEARNRERGCIGGASPAPFSVGADIARDVKVHGALSVRVMTQITCRLV